MRLGTTVLYRSFTGDYTIPAIVTATRSSLNPRGVELGVVPDLTEDTNVHLAVFTPGLPGGATVTDLADPDTPVPHIPPRLFTRIIPAKPLGERTTDDADPESILVATALGGTYQEWNRPVDPALADVDPSLWATFQLGFDDQAPGTWAPREAFADVDL